MNPIHHCAADGNTRGSHRDTLSLLAAYTAFLVCACSLEAIWYLGLAQNLYEQALGDLLVPQFSLPAAAAFYIIYASGALYFAVAPALASGGMRSAMLRGAAYGFFCFSAHNFTDVADVRGYSAWIAAVDIPWGVFMSGFASSIAYLAGRAAARVKCRQSRTPAENA